VVAVVTDTPTTLTEVDRGVGENSGAGAGAGERELIYPTVEMFVNGYLLEHYRRPVSSNSSTWCPEWWLHAEAIIRLEALWRSWEKLRLDAALGMSVWLREHADHHMTVLLSANGPLKGCTPKQHSARPLPPLPSTPAPLGQFG